GATLILCSHLGRPKGAVVDGLRLDPVADRLRSLGVEVSKLDRVVGPEVDAAAERAAPGDVLLLENLRFEPGEERGDPAFADALARPAAAYVDDAFGAAHRAHASVVGVAERLPSAAGRLMQAEVEALTRVRDDPARPFVAILGGAKVSDKLGVVEALIERVDALLVGGAMAFTFLAARGLEVGESLVEPDRFDDVRAAEQKAKERGVDLRLPVDVVVADRAEAGATPRTVEAGAIPAGMKGLDVGPATVADFGRAIGGAATVLWNGPMGMFELAPFAAGTAGVADAVASCDGFTVVGGGDSIAALAALGRLGAIGHVSTGGGASLEFIEGRTLPGIDVLMEAA
ncbi:MAG TPA: phosphoglycerate kinase, partial [Actinomycetota bacterium]